MLFQYNYDDAVILLDFLKENKIARLDVQQENGVTIIEYKLISDLPYLEQTKCLQVLSDNLGHRMYLINLWNDFIVSKSAGRDVYLKVEFNAIQTRKLEFTCTVSGNMIHSNRENTRYEKVTRCLEVLQLALTDMGVLDQQLVNVYRKEGVGRSKKHIPLTLGDLITYIYKAIED